MESLGEMLRRQPNGGAMQELTIGSLKKMLRRRSRTEGKAALNMEAWRDSLDLWSGLEVIVEPRTSRATAILAAGAFWRRS